MSDVSVIWHEVENAAYAADLPLWEELAEDSKGPVLDLGCGSGRVALHLGRRGYSVQGLDSDPELVAALNTRAGELPVSALVGDVRKFELETEFELILAPMQVIQLLPGLEDRLDCLGCVAAHLAPGGLAAFAIVDGMPQLGDTPPPLPDTREVDGWVYSSQPTETFVGIELIRARRLRQTVSPTGELSEEMSEDVLCTLRAQRLEQEASRAGLRSAGHRMVPQTEDHVGSTVVLLEKES
jgi:SAM-dependent methyltransferase